MAVNIEATQRMQRALAQFELESAMERGDALYLSPPEEMDRAGAAYAKPRALAKLGITRALMWGALAWAIGAAIIFLIMATSTPAQSATITRSDTAPIAGIAFDLDTSDFRTRGPGGRGASVIGDGRSVVEKTAASPKNFGRSAATPGGSWIDSNDNSEVRMLVDFDGKKVTSFSFRASDAHDMRNSFFNIASGGEVWTKAERGANAAVDWITKVFSKPVDRALFVFRTTENPGGDGFGISDASYCPVDA